MTLTLWSRLQEMLPSTLCIMLPMYLQSLKLLCPTLMRKRCINKKIHYCTLTLTLGPRSYETLANIRLSSTSCDLHLQKICCYVQGFRRRIYKKTQLTFDLGVKVTQSIAQYPLHHVIYTPAKFEVAMSNG